MLRFRQWHTETQESIQMELKEIKLGNREFLSIFWKLLGICAGFWSFTDNMLPSKLINIYSIVAAWLPFYYTVMLAKIPFDSMSFT